MSLRFNGRNWVMSFSIAALNICRSTRTDDKEQAQEIERQAKELLRREQKKDKYDRRPVDEVLRGLFLEKANGC